MAFADTQTGAVLLHGESPASIELAGTVAKGDAVGFSGGWKRALATAAGVIQLRCIAGEDGVSGQKITAYFGVVLIDARFTGATAGGALYVAEGTSNGMFTQTAPTTSTDANTIVGYALSATSAALTPNFNVDSVV